MPIEPFYSHEQTWSVQRRVLEPFPGGVYDMEPHLPSPLRALRFSPPSSDNEAIAH